MICGCLYMCATPSPSPPSSYHTERIFTCATFFYSVHLFIFISPRHIRYYICTHVMEDIKSLFYFPFRFSMIWGKRAKPHSHHHTLHQFCQSCLREMWQIYVVVCTHVNISIRPTFSNSKKRTKEFLKNGNIDIFWKRKTKPAILEIQHRKSNRR